MALAQDHEDHELPYLPFVKQISGKRVEVERRRRGISQVALGRAAGLGPTWIRHLEGGYAKVRLDDHLACLQILDTSSLSVFIPILFASHDRQFPAQLLMGDLKRLEVILIDAVVNWNLTNLQSMLGDADQRANI